MLTRTTGHNQQPPRSVAASEEPGFSFDFAYYKKVLLREWPLIAMISLAVIALAIAYVLLATPKYTAEAALMIDTRKNQLLETQQVITDATLDTSGIESQVEVLKSESVALAVIRKLKLADDPDLLKPSLLGSLVPSFLSGAIEAPTPFIRERAAVANFNKNLTIKRLGLTYVITVDFTATSPQKAASVANAVVEAYIGNEINARFERTKQSSDWLKARIEGLRSEANAAEHAVQKYRSDNTIVDTGRGLLSEQQIADLSSQLALAKAATSEAKAKLDRINVLSAQDVPDASVADALKNDVITRLRAQYLDLSARAADFSARYGEQHQATTRVRDQMNQIKLSIKDEIRRIAESYKSDYSIAEARERSLDDSLSRLVSAAGTQGQVAVKLHDLESASQSSRNIYDNFLQKSMESTQQQTFPTSDARLITAATPPLFKSSPKTLLVLPGSIILGLIFGCLAALGRERLNTAFQSVSQVEALTGFTCLGILPKVKANRFRIAQGASAPVPQQIATSSQALRYVLTSPFSRFAETVRSVKVAIDVAGLSHPRKIIGVVSALSHEGKSTVAANLAQLIAKTNKDVLLLDCDMRNPSLTASLAPHAQAGLLEILDQSERMSDVVCSDVETNLRFIPTVLKSRISHTSEILSSQVMANFLKVASEHYSYIIVDLPPIASVVDVRAMGHLIDNFVCVVEWGKTSRDTVFGALSATDVVRNKLIGIVLNKASEAALQRSENAEGGYHMNYYFDNLEKV